MEALVVSYAAIVPVVLERRWDELERVKEFP